MNRMNVTYFEVSLYSVITHCTCNVYIPEHMYIGISKSMLTALISFFAIFVISDRFN